MKDLYYNIRTRNIEIDPQTSELILYILQQKGMHAEVLDFCETFAK